MDQNFTKGEGQMGITSFQDQNADLIFKSDANIDSNVEKAIIGKPDEQIKLRKLMRMKLQTTSIPEIDFEDCEGNYYKFSSFYDYHKFLGCGSFGFVVSAIDKASGDHLALKVRTFLPLSSAKAYEMQF